MAARHFSAKPKAAFKDDIEFVLRKHKVFLCSQFRLKSNLFGKEMRADFLIKLPTKGDTAVFLRWQDSGSGAAISEKAPFLIESCLNLDLPSLIIYGGTHPDEAMLEWAINRTEALRCVDVIRDDGLNTYLTGQLS